MEYLNRAEQTDLAGLERKIESHLATFVQVGMALLEIRDRNLYRAAYPSFEAYCEGRWHLGRSHGYRLMDAATIAMEVSPKGGHPTPQTERQTRPLKPLPAEQRQQVWEQAVEQSGGKQPAAADVEALAAAALAALPAARQQEVIEASEEKILKRQRQRDRKREHAGRVKRIERARALVSRARRLTDGLAHEAEKAIVAFDRVLGLLDSLESAYDTLEEELEALDQ